MSSTQPACSAAFASWIWRTSYCVITSSGSPRQRTYENVRPSATTRDERSASDPSIVPSVVRIPARWSSAIASMIPEPQTPVTCAAANPGSSDQASVPITRMRGSSVSGSMRTRSIAPGAARCPHEICAPSNAGPVGLEAASRRSRLPSTISAFVPTSTRRLTSSARCGASERTTPAVSAPTWPAMHGSTYARAPGCTGRPSSRAGMRSGLVDRQGERRAAERRRVDPEQEVVHDRVADERDLEHVRALDSGARRELCRELREAAADGAGELLLGPGCSIT